MPQSQSIKKPAPVSWHNKNFEDYLIQYAQANELAMRGEVWVEALAAARRLGMTINKIPNLKARAFNPALKLATAF